MNTTLPKSLEQWPLWRLIVAAHDAEQSVGPKSPTTRVLNRIIKDRLRSERSATKSKDRRERGVK